MEQGSPLCEAHDCVKEMTLWAQEQEQIIVSEYISSANERTAFLKLCLFMLSNTFDYRVV